MNAAAALQPVVAALATVILGMGVLQAVVQVLQLAAAANAFAKRRSSSGSEALWRRFAPAAPPISILMPAYNEELSIVDSVRALLSLRYPDFEVIVINDGSSDATLQRLTEAFGLIVRAERTAPVLETRLIRCVYEARHQPKLLVVDKVNGGKADALNAGLNFADRPVFSAIDADSVLEAEALLRAVQPFIDDPARTVAVGGAIRIANGCTVSKGEVLNVAPPRNILALFQTVEYLRAFLMGRIAWGEAGALTIISGAFGLFRRDRVIEVGGYTRHTVGEDMDLVLKLHRRELEAGRPYRISFEPEPVCWTQAPESFAELARQRARWQRGALETYARHESLLFNPRYRAVGLLGLPYVLLVDVLGPLAEVAGYLLLPAFWLLGLLSPAYFAAYFSVSVAFGVAVSVGGLVLEEVRLHRFPKVGHLAVLLGAAVVENFGYRQLTNIWRLRGVAQYLRGAKTWGEMSRRGFTASAPA